MSGVDEGRIALEAYRTILIAMEPVEGRRALGRARGRVRGSQRWRGHGCRRRRANGTFGLDRVDEGVGSAAPWLACLAQVLTSDPLADTSFEAIELLNGLYDWRVSK